MKSAYDYHIADGYSKNVIAPQSATEDLHEDYLLKIKSHSKGDGDYEEKLEQAKKDKSVAVVPPGSARDELLSDYRAQVKNKKWTRRKKQSNKKVHNPEKKPNIKFNGFKMYLSIVW